MTTARSLPIPARNLPAFGALVLAVLGMPAAHAVDPATLASAGKGELLACGACHGPEGGGAGLFPRLAGMNAVYLRKQLDDFDSGVRHNSVMQPIARALSSDERDAISRYYARMPIPEARRRPAPDAAGPDAPGASLALRGKWSENVPACVQCHGPGGIGVGDAFPSIAAQPAGYLAAQLRAWQDGGRRNDPLQLMRHLSASLSEAEVQAVSEWFAVQPATAMDDPQ